MSIGCCRIAVPSHNTTTMQAVNHAHKGTHPRAVSPLGGWGPRVVDDDDRGAEDVEVEERAAQVRVVLDPGDVGPARGQEDEPGRRGAVLLCVGVLIC